MIRTPEGAGCLNSSGVAALGAALPAGGFASHSKTTTDCQSFHFNESLLQRLKAIGRSSIVEQRFILSTKSIKYRAVQKAG
eukprot:614712-Amphidinium_carterae.2